MRNLWPALLLLLLSSQGVWAQMVPSDAHREANFLYEVKVIDEFIERFNDDSLSAIRKEYKQSGRTVPFKRTDLLLALFDQPIKPGDSSSTRFIAQVTDSAKPQFLSFNDSNWYDEVLCVFTMNGEKMEIPLIMQVNTAANHSAKWMIAGIGDAPVFKNEALVESEQKQEDAKIRKFISPSDYATNFLELHHLLAPGMHPENYFVAPLLATDKAKKFVQLIRSGKLKFEYTAKMKFYFFQIPNYSFTVERFERQTTHSGWLISTLSPVPEDQKKTRLEQLLQRSL